MLQVQEPRIARLRQIKPTRPQYDILTSRQAVNLFLAGQGSGKSHCAGLVSANFISNFPKIRGIICANTESQLTKSTMFRIREVWKDNFGMTEWNEKTKKGCYVVDKIPPAHFDISDHNFDSHYNIISFENGAVVFLASLENYKAIDGIEVGWALLDETKDTREQAVKEVITGRLRQQGIYIDASGNLTTKDKAMSVDATGSLVDNTPFNPLYIFTSPANVPWINDWFYLNDYEKEINELIFSETTYFKKSVSNKFVTISSTYLNTENLPSNYIENQKANLHTALQDMLIYGSPFAKGGGEFYKYFDRAKHVGKITELLPQIFGTGKTPYAPDRALFISVDENAVPYFPMGIYQAIDDRKIGALPGKFKGKFLLVKIDEIAATWPNNTTDYICAEFTRRYYNHVSGVDLFGDATSHKDDVKQEKGFDLFRLICNQLSKYRVRDRTTKSNPSVSGRGDFINTVMEKEYSDLMFIIDEGCSRSIADYNNVKEKSDRSGKDKTLVKDPATGRSYQPWGHFSDEGDYIMCVLWLNEFTKYQKGDKPTSFNYAPPTHARY